MVGDDVVFSEAKTWETLGVKEEKKKDKKSKDKDKNKEKDKEKNKEKKKDILFLKIL